MNSTTNRSNNMSYNLKMLLQAFVSQTFTEENRNHSQLNLYNDTIQFIQKAEKEIGIEVKLEEIRVCLDAFDKYIQDKKTPELDNSVLQSLVQIWIDRLTLFNN